MNAGVRAVLMGTLIFCLTNTFVYGDSGRLQPSAVTKFSKSHDGSTVHYQIAGQGQPVLLFIHGWVAEATYWQYQVESFSTCFKVIALDLPGHGLSTSNRITWDMASFASDVVSLIHHLNLKDIILVGHDMGGVVAVEAAARLPERVLGVIGVESLVDTRPDSSSSLQKAILTRLREDFPNTVHQVILDLFGEDADPALTQRISEAAAQAQPQVALPILEHLLDHDVAEALSKISAPILIVNTSYNSPKLSRLHEAAPHIEAWEATWDGHFGFLEKPELFNHILNRGIVHLLDRKSQPRNRRDTRCLLP